MTSSTKPEYMCSDIRIFAVEAPIGTRRASSRSRDRTSDISSGYQGYISHSNIDWSCRHRFWTFLECSRTSLVILNGSVAFSRYSTWNLYSYFRLDAQLKHSVVLLRVNDVAIDLYNKKRVAHEKIWSTDSRRRQNLPRSTTGDRPLMIFTHDFDQWFCTIHIIRSFTPDPIDDTVGDGRALS